MMTRLFILCICLSGCFFPEKLVAQSLPDTGKVMPLTTFLNLVKTYHPVSRQSVLFTRIGQAELLAGRGGFDPKLFGDYEQKYFDSKNYFAVGEYGVKVPTWFGIEVKGSYATSGGVFLSPENTLPNNGQLNLGVSFPLLQNLMIDERRANLYKSRQSPGLNQADRDALLNDLAIEAVKNYWKWAYYYQQMQIFKQALIIAEQRFVATKATFELGDRMAMDTLESFIQVQDRTFQYNEATLEYQDAARKLANFLWQNETQPIAFADQWQPSNINEDPLSITRLTDDQRDIFIKTLVETHPLLRGYQFKIAQLDIDRKLKQEKLKPKLNLNYNVLGNGANITNLLTDNYKWGISFSSSTLFRSERGDVQLANIKIENTRLMRDQKALELENKLRQYFNEVDNLQAQIQLYNETVNNYQRLLQLENARFELGESSLFLINSRELKFIEAQVKVAKLKSEWLIARASVEWASGRLVF